MFASSERPTGDKAAPSDSKGFRRYHPQISKQKSFGNDALFVYNMTKENWVKLMVDAEMLIVGRV